jgi:hypothetical protein
MFHTKDLELTHPITLERIRFSSDFPDEFNISMNRLAKDVYQ